MDSDDDVNENFNIAELGDNEAHVTSFEQVRAPNSNFVDVHMMKYKEDNTNK